MTSLSISLPTSPFAPATTSLPGGFPRRLLAVAVGPELPPSDSAFTGLVQAYRSSGGLVRGDDVADWLRDSGRGGHGTLARWIVSGEILGFEWQHALWIPMFQIDPATLVVRSGARQVLAQMGSAFDGWSLALWFVQPNSWLQDRRPLDLLDSALPDVLEAARADRFVVTG